MTNAHTACVVSIGSELLLGLVVDTNASWLCQELSSLGWSVKSVRAVGDVTDDIVAALHAAASESCLVLVTGGLGPTADDRTREALARAMNQPLEERAELVAQIEERFRQIGRPMRPINRVQAGIPATAVGIHNTCGTAPGIYAQLGSATVYVMPGVPREMKEMFRRSVRPEIELPASAGVERMRRLHIFGLGESTVGEAIHEMMAEASNPLIGTTVKEGVITVRIRARAGTAEEADLLLEDADARISERFSDDVFGRDDESLASVVVRLLSERGETLALAESCTGGMIASAIVDVAGASQVLREGIVAYANAAKTQRLGVPAELLAADGAVSQAAVRAMALGAREKAGTTWALAVTGIAGPDGGSDDKPVGTVWLALAGPFGVCYTTRRFASDRFGNRLRTTHQALDLLRRMMVGASLPWETVVEHP